MSLIHVIKLEGHFLGNRCRLEFPIILTENRSFHGPTSGTITKYRIVYQAKDQKRMPFWRTGGADAAAKNVSQNTFCVA